MPHVPEKLTPSCAHLPTAKAAGSSFYWAMRLMPADRRDAMFRVYAFCREVDDVADEPGEASQKMATLENWRQDVESLYDPSGPAKSIECLKPVVDRFDLQKSDFLAVIDGMKTDAHDEVRMDDEGAFDLYIDRVACAVGRLSDRVFGLSGPVSDELAYHLGRALQITNILRDLDEDAGRNRLYLPRDLLRFNGIETDGPREVLSHEKIGLVLQDLAQRAHRHFNKAERAIAQLDKRKTRPARIMMAVYQRVLQKLEARGLVRVDVPVKLNKVSKLWLAFRHGIL